MGVMQGSLVLGRPMSTQALVQVFMEVPWLSLWQLPQTLVSARRRQQGRLLPSIHLHRWGQALQEAVLVTRVTQVQGMVWWSLGISTLQRWLRPRTRAQLPRMPPGD